jgi:ribosome-binding protein aMBF1 (putative translation factor)
MAASVAEARNWPIGRRFVRQTHRFDAAVTHEMEISAREATGRTTVAMQDARLALGCGFAGTIADVVREARRLVGWSQRDLAARARTSQTMISRIERAHVFALDALVVERVLAALGIRASLDLDARHLDDRRRQRDAVHARLTGSVARCLERQGWRTATEVPLGDGTPRGWIDLLAFRQADRALLVEESKTEILDVGALQRSLAFYEREAWRAARQLGWRPALAVVLCAVLDTDAVARRVVENRDLVSRAFPASVLTAAAWLRDPTAAVPGGWVLGMVDPAVRGRRWLRPTPLGGRHRVHAYGHYAEAAARLRSR